MRNRAEFYSTDNEEEKSLERPRSNWQQFGRKVLELFHIRAKENPPAAEATETAIAIETDKPTSEPVELNALAAEKFHEPTTADEITLVREMEYYRSRQKDHLRGERAQEIRENEFNTKLSMLEDLEMADETDGVSRRVETYDGKEIPVYDLAGYPFRFLQHVVGYKLASEGNPNIIGFNTARRLLDKPALWIRQETEINMDGKNADQEANTLSTTYIDTEINMKGGANDKYGVTYGFSSLRPDSIIATYNGDGATNNKAGKIRPLERDFSFSPDELARNSTHLYNEVLLRRYSEEGAPQTPDFLIVHNGVITDDTKRHAAYFGVPIINIEDKVYLDRQKEHLISQINSLNDKSSYDEIFRVFQEADQSSLSITAPWKEDIYVDYGDNEDRVYSGRLMLLPDDTRNKMQNLIEEIEPAKRLAMLDIELKRVTSELAQVEGQEKYRVDNPFYVRRFTRRNRQASGASYDPGTFVDSVSIEYQYKLDNGKRRPIKTVMDSTDAAYEYFSDLVDQYETSGGSVHDDRIKRNSAE